MTWRTTARLLALLTIVNLSCNNPVDRDGQPITSGTYRLRTFPSGAQVWIDGELKIEATPATLVLPEGEYRLKIQARGAEAIERTIEIEAGERKDITLNIPRPPPATITVLSDVTGAKVRINGYVRGRTPLKKKTTKPGPIDITVISPDGRAKSIRARLEISEQKIIEVSFAAPPPSNPAAPVKTSTDAMGLVTLGMKPDGVLVDGQGRRIARTPIRNRPFAAGSHRVLLKSEDGRYQRWVTIEVEKGKQATFRFRLGKDDLVRNR